MAILSTLQRDLLLAWRNPSKVVNALLFFLLVLIMFPFGVGYGPNQLSAIAPGVVWVTVLLSLLLSLDTLFKDDAEHGYIDLMLCSPTPLVFLIYAKLLAHWLTSALPIIILAPLLSLFYSLPDSALLALIITLLLGTPTLVCIGAIGAALTVNLKQSQILLALIILPLYIPIVIFAASAVTAGGEGLRYTGQIYFLAAFLLIAITLAPFAISAALKLARQ